MNRPRITGSFDLSLILPVAVGLLYAGTGGWSAERWNTAFTVMGISVIKKSTEYGYERGYNTYNPDLRQPPQGIELFQGELHDPEPPEDALPRDSHGRFKSRH